MIDEELEQVEAFKDWLAVFVVERGLSLLIAVLIIALGFWIGKIAAGVILKVAEKRAIDVTLARFFAGCARLIIIGLAVIVGISKAGIVITPFVALLGASAFGLSLAVQGPISNYGAGIVLILTRPFVVNDTLTLNGLTGRVDSVNLGNTQLLNDDEERITIPNRKVLGEIFVNSYEYRIVEASVGIDYKADPEAAIRCIREAIATVPETAPDREPEVGIEGFGDSSIDIAFRVWVPMAQFHKKRFALNLAVYHALKKADITIPFPQRDVHLIKDEA